MKTRILSGLACGILWLLIAPARSWAKPPVEADSSAAFPRSLDFNLINGSFVSLTNGSAGRFQMRFCIEPTFTFSNKHENNKPQEDKNSETDALINLSAIPLFRLSSGRRIQTYAGCGPILSFHEYKYLYSLTSENESFRVQTFHQSEWSAGIRAIAGLRIPLPRRMALFSEYHFTLLRGWGNESRDYDYDNVDPSRSQTRTWNARFSPIRFGLSIAI